MIIHIINSSIREVAQGIENSISVYKQDGKIFCGIMDKDMAESFVLHYCDRVVQQRYHGDEWETTIVIDKNINCGEYEVSEVIFTTKEGDEMTCRVSDNILEDVSYCMIDDIYFMMCERLAMVVP